MPATPPLEIEQSASTLAETCTTEKHPDKGSRFTLRYDKLVIAVGAYSQSM